MHDQNTLKHPQTSDTLLITHLWKPAARDEHTSHLDPKAYRIRTRTGLATHGHREADMTSSLSTPEDCISEEIPHTTPLKSHFRREASLHNEKTAMNAWRASSCRARLKLNLEEHAPPGGWKLTKFVLLGVGSLTKDDDNYLPQHITQMVLFKDFVTLVCDPDYKNPELFVQEPQFSSDDKAAARMYGLTVLEEPHAESIIDRSTLVVAPFTVLDSSILGVEVDLQPAVHLGLRWGFFLQYAMRDIARWRDHLRGNETFFVREGGIT